MIGNVNCDCLFCCLWTVWSESSCNLRLSLIAMDNFCINSSELNELISLQLNKLMWLKISRCISNQMMLSFVSLRSSLRSWDGRLDGDGLCPENDSCSLMQLIFECAIHISIDMLIQLDQRVRRQRQLISSSPVYEMCKAVLELGCVVS